MDPGNYYFMRVHRYPFACEKKIINDFHRGENVDLVFVIYICVGTKYYCHIFYFYIINLTLVL